MWHYKNKFCNWKCCVKFIWIHIICTCALSNSQKEEFVYFRMWRYSYLFLRTETELDMCGSRRTRLVHSLCFCSHRNGYWVQKSIHWELQLFILLFQMKKQVDKSAKIDLKVCRHTVWGKTGSISKGKKLEVSWRFSVFTACYRV